MGCRWTVREAREQCWSRITMVTGVSCLDSGQDSGRVFQESEVTLQQLLCYVKVHNQFLNQSGPSSNMMCLNYTPSNVRTKFGWARPGGPSNGRNVQKIWRLEFKFYVILQFWPISIYRYLLCTPNYTKVCLCGSSSGRFYAAVVVVASTLRKP